MAESIVSDVVVRLFEHLGQSALGGITPYFGGRSKLEKLNNTMRMIEARLLDAERLQESEGRAVVKEWLKRLKRLLYRMEDLFEEVAVADKEKGQMPRGNLIQLLHSKFFKNSRPFTLNKQIAQESKAVMEELKSVTSIMLSLNLRVHCVEEQRALSLINRGETHSFILEEEVVGRDTDKHAIVRMLLDSGDHVDQQSISIIPIVGIGGIGKTTLAQLAFSDKIVQEHFELKGWACVSAFSSSEELVRKILTCITGEDYQQFSMDQLQGRLRGVINGKKYLLVLDDIWDEDRERWVFLRRLLRGGICGSKIIITSRSGVVALNMGTVKPYNLKGLAEDKSWELFRSLAFRKGQEEENPNLTNIGRDIAQNCGNVPLAIRSIAGLLYSKDTEEEWMCLRDNESSMREQGGNVISTLKLSYDHLPAQLKQCFAYCSLFPKNYKFDKHRLICLWMAQGFIGSSKGTRSPEDVGDACFMELLKRCFFQDDERNEDDEIINFRMHALMHDLAQHVAGGETLLVEKCAQKISEDIRHVNFISASSIKVSSCLQSARLMRSLFVIADRSLDMKTVFSRLRFLRALDLTMVNCQKLPNSIGKLKHLRYLRLGGPLDYLPECITRLRNLQTLDLTTCYQLRELPRGFTKLTDLRHLHIETARLIGMPPGFGQLTSIQTLRYFRIGESNGLDALGSMNNLAGKLKITFDRHRANAKSEARAAKLKVKKITDLELDWSLCEETIGQVGDDEDESTLKCLQPPPSLKRLTVSFWKGLRFPSWGMDELPCLLSNLVSIVIEGCSRCQHLPPLTQLPHLKSLDLCDLDALEYIEIDSRGVNSYFRSLEHLVLSYLPELKRWTMGQDGIDPHMILKPLFPCLAELIIEDCPKLKSMPTMPRLQSLSAINIHKKLLKCILSPTSSPSNSLLREVHIDSICGLYSLSIRHFSLECLRIYRCHWLMKLIVEPPTSLAPLDIQDCHRLKNISGVLQQPYIEGLETQACGELDCSDAAAATGDWSVSRGRSATVHQQAYLSMFMQSLARVKPFDEKRPIRGQAVRELADKTLAITATGESRWRQAMLGDLKLGGKHNIYEKVRWRLRPPLSRAGRKARALARLVPGGQHLSLRELLEEAPDYIKALEMQIQCMQTVLYMLPMRPICISPGSYARGKC